ncbi:MAG: hypothetical protein H8D56_12910, partial [Planctomycetes bacterium]|nr:hypothetical protein [Planctomycetota bacterium]
MAKKTLTITLKDQCADVHLKTIKVKLLSEGGKLWIRPKGYSDKCSADGHGYPVGLEIWQGRLRLIVFNDINMEEPQIIDLENARESNRDSGDITMSHLKKRFVLVVDGRELATILAALRFHQDENLQGCSDIADQAIKEIATNSGSLKPLDFNEVGKLCERVNTCEEAHSGHQKEVWVLAVMNKNMVVHTQAYNSRFRAEKAMLDYLRSYEGYKGKDNVAEVCDWLAKQEGTLKVDICSTQVDC